MRCSSLFTPPLLTLVAAALIPWGCGDNKPLKSLNDPCIKNEDCYDKICHRGLCASSNPTDNGGPCHGPGHCKSYKCQASRCIQGNAAGGSNCRHSEECASKQCVAGKCEGPGPSDAGPDATKDGPLPDKPKTAPDGPVADIKPVLDIKPALDKKPAPDSKPTKDTKPPPDTKPATDTKPWPDQMMPDLFKPDTVPDCGNGKLDPKEPCDGTKMGTNTCKSNNFDGGTISCNKNCTLNTSLCHKCGDSKITSPETCDGSNLGGATCTGAGFHSGTPGCTNCKVDYAYCRTGGYVTVPAGYFYMGSPGSSSDPCYGFLGAYNEDYHKVIFTYAYEIMPNEAIQSGFYKAVGYNPSANNKGTATQYHPVENVNWHEAAAYCNEGSTNTSQEKCYKCSNTKTKNVICTVESKYVGANIFKCPGFRLPTEAEWERAARAGSSTSTHKGNITNCKTTDSVAGAAGWYSGNAFTSTRGVASKKNNWGISDMCGNVFEWMHDYYVANHGTSTATDPAGPNNGSTHAIRGGAYNSYAGSLRVTARGPHPKTSRMGVIGLRCVRLVK